MRRLLLALSISIATSASSRASAQPLVELDVRGGAGFAQCSGCDGTGAVAQASALFRPKEHWALGASWRSQYIPRDPESFDLGFLAATFRLYPIGDTPWQPWLELAAGKAFFQVRTPFCNNSGGAALQSRIGIDYSATTWLRLGLAADGMFVSSGTDCGDVSTSFQISPVGGILVGGVVGF